jgi:hypothetical protein
MLPATRVQHHREWVAESSRIVFPHFFTSVLQLPVKTTNSVVLFGCNPSLITAGLTLSLTAPLTRSTNGNRLRSSIQLSPRSHLVPFASNKTHLPLPRLQSLSSSPVHSCQPSHLSQQQADPLSFHLRRGSGVRSRSAAHRTASTRTARADRAVRARRGPRTARLVA